MEKLDLTQVLKDCPVGTKLYSPIYGDVEFFSLRKEDAKYAIRIKVFDTEGESSVAELTKDGRYLKYFDAECMLFPSKDNRDWSTFKVPKPEPKFMPFQTVLVMDPIDGVWDADFYAYFDKNAGLHRCIMHSAKVCIPYDGNEELLGTTDKPKEKEE